MRRPSHTTAQRWHSKGNTEHIRHEIEVARIIGELLHHRQDVLNHRLLVGVQPLRNLLQLPLACASRQQI